MYFLGFPVYRLDHSAYMATASKDPDSAFFKKLDTFQPCEITELKPGTHVFAVYGDNFFKSASYTIEVLSAAPFANEKDELRAVETRVLTKRVELSMFESEYREVLAHFTEMTSSYTQEMLSIDNLPLAIQRHCKNAAGCLPQLLDLADDSDDIEELMSLSPEKILLKWMNFHLKQGGYEQTVTNFSSDLKE